MASGALQFRVGAQQCEMRLLRMIEHPQRPAVGRMAVLALLAEPALVHVVVRMAVGTGRRRTAVGERRCGTARS